MSTTPTDTLTTDDDLASRAALRGPGGPTPRGDEDAFAQLYERHARPLLAFLHARARRHDAEDLAQEVWCCAWAHLPGGFRGGNFRAWLFEIARNALVDHIRKRRDQSLGDGEPLLLDGRSGSPEDVMIERERAEKLRRCLERLGAESAALVRPGSGVKPTTWFVPGSASPNRGPTRCSTRPRDSCKSAWSDPGMKSIALEIPDEPAELADWLERHLVGPDLAALVAELEAVHGADAPGASARLDEVLGDRGDAVMAQGLSALPAKRSAGS